MLEFSLHGTRYRVTRVPEHQRPKKRGDGFTTEASRVHLERLEAGGWSSLSSNKAEVGELITEAVGLNREQFTQVMLLPQGEFARFLRARDDDRRELLTKLFGTQLYDKITAELDRRRYEAARLREEAAQAVSAAVSAAAEAAGLDADLPRRGAGAAPRRPGDPAEGGERRAWPRPWPSPARALEVAIARVAAARAAAEQAAQQAALMARLTEALAALGEHEAHPARARPAGGRLAAARRADPVRPLLAALAEAEAAAGAARDALAAPGRPARDEDALAGRGGRETARRADAKEAAAASLQRLAELESAVPGRRVTLAELEHAAAARPAW